MTSIAKGEMMTITYETDENGCPVMIMDHGFGFIQKMDCPAVS